jgi:NADH dehydrogenase (ubiquinone) 1 alpha subcomplex subunit 5
MFRTLALRAASQASASAAAASPVARTKLSTEITGLAVHPAPLAALRSTYESTLRLLDALPAASVYAGAARAVTQARLDVVNGASGAESEAAILHVEQTLQLGQAEELLLQAQDELKLAAKMAEWKA